MSRLHTIIPYMRQRTLVIAVLSAALAVMISTGIRQSFGLTSALIFAGAIGFLWLATVPLTSGTVAQIFGVRYLSTLFGIVFLSHQVGAFLGVWLGGRLYDTTGSYNLVWYMAIGLSVLASLVHTPISDAPVLQPQLVGTQAKL